MEGTGFSWPDIVEDVIDRAGGQEAPAAYLMKIRRGLRILTERWAAAGYNAWRIKQAVVGSDTVALPIVPLPDDVDDIVAVNALRADATESNMRRVTPAEYAQLATKTVGGQPSMWYLERTSPPTLRVFPTGPSRLSIWYVARPAEFDPYSYTPDDDGVPGRWLEALIAGLAHDLARKIQPRDAALIAELKQEMQEAEDRAQRADRDRTPYAYRPSFGWRRR